MRRLCEGDVNAGGRRQEPEGRRREEDPPITAITQIRDQRVAGVQRKGAEPKARSCRESCRILRARVGLLHVNTQTYEGRTVRATDPGREDNRTWISAPLRPGFVRVRRAGEKQLQRINTCSHESARYNLSSATIKRQCRLSRYGLGIAWSD